MIVYVADLMLKIEAEDQYQAWLEFKRKISHGEYSSKNARIVTEEQNKSERKAVFNAYGL